ncbi:peptidyl-prolyl cis-trans isomerase [Marinagarivorans algicola]|uniref:peptidyl-prolyl cis-trans isomerase n=1 Tax=Marinagarivorans algicola TaxID=1513270 RepID=UPI0006B569F1|nr:peptidyl-prolyl cis-trans isomerase [Marinagarivorans algicola]
MDQFFLRPAALILCAVLAACQSPVTPTSKDSAQPAPTNAIVDVSVGAPVLARVNKQTITDAHLDFALSRLTAGSVVPINDVLKSKVLESLISSRAMAILQAQTLTPAAQKQLALKVAAYREELLVKDYINAHSTPVPVTNAQVKAYYQNNLKDFGGDNIKSFEYIESAQVQDDNTVATLKEALNTLAYASDWAKAAAALRAQGLPVTFKQAKMREQLMKAPFKSVVEATPAGQKTAVHVGDTLWVLKVTRHQTMAAKPLAQVSHQIRKALAPLQIKAAIKAVSDQARQKVIIE